MKQDGIRQESIPRRLNCHKIFLFTEDQEISLGHHEMYSFQFLTYDRVFQRTLAFEAGEPFAVGHSPDYSGVFSGIPDLYAC